MLQRFVLLCIVTALLAACLPVTSFLPTVKDDGPATVTCAVTQPTQAQPPDDPNADPFGFGDWYINADRTIWVGLPPVGSWRTGGEKVIWIRPAGTDLTVTGQRLDAEAPPLRADIPCCYSTGFQVTGLYFPTEGCWEVTATADEHELRFVTRVAGSAPPSEAGGGSTGKAPVMPVGGVQLLLVDHYDQEILRSRPVDPLTLADLPGYEPIPFGHHYTYALSTDQAKLALISWPSGASNSGGELQVIDLAAWAVHATGVRFDSYISHLRFSQDGQLLYWLAPSHHHPAHGLPRRYQLYRYSVTDGQPVAIYEFADSFAPWSMQLVNGGRRLAVFGVPTDAQNLVEDVPYLYLLDLPDGALATALPLEGIRAGQFQLETGEGGGYSYAYYVPGLAWDMSSNRLYVADLEAEMLVVVNLVTGTIAEQISLRPRLSWGERIINWLMPVAAAKLAPGARIQAAIHSGTGRLYLTGSQLDVWQSDTGGYRWQEQALGLRVFDLEKLEMMQHIKLAVSSATITPNGHYVVVSAMPMQASPQEQGAAADGYGLYLFQADSLDLVADVPVDGWFQIDEFVFNDYVYVHIGTELDSGEWITALQARAAPSLAVVAERTLEGSYADLIGVDNRQID